MAQRIEILFARAQDIGGASIGSEYRRWLLMQTAARRIRDEIKRLAAASQPVGQGRIGGVTSSRSAPSRSNGEIIMRRMMGACVWGRRSCQAR